MNFDTDYNSSETLLEEHYKYNNELESIYSFIAEGIILLTCKKSYSVMVGKR